MVLAHQGGWDEILLVAGPLLVLALLLRAARRRADAERDGPDGGDHPAMPAGGAGANGADANGAGDLGSPSPPEAQGR